MGRDTMTLSHTVSQSVEQGFLTPQAQLSLQGTFGVWTDIKVLWNSNEGEAGNPKHNKFRTFFFVRVETLTSEWYGHLFFWNHFIIYQNCTFKGQLCLAGYAQSSVPEELISKIFPVFFQSQADIKQMSMVDQPDLIDGHCIKSEDNLEMIPLMHKF